MKKSEASALLNDNFLDLNEPDDVSEPWYSSLVRGELKVSRICSLTAGTVLVGFIILSWTAIALSKSSKSLRQASSDSFKANQRLQQSVWGKSAVVAERKSSSPYYQGGFSTGNSNTRRRSKMSGGPFLDPAEPVSQYVRYRRDQAAEEAAAASA
eukprot:CAMPEP_0172152916 /NCGR_PEP_ID=MMETSP1050-20130122/1125_1 /TAXON_ID=233186 /ORGANISM="Cryptomonas curvata, Strain CCAP979/52" /LENGTH=154 /DNA_ID=CAMNT_0012821335 /DNA_START=1791 /DNA_END=2252 /DNA_ORIENTATION=+